MADDDKKDPKKDPEKTEKDTDTGDKGDPWEKMGGLVRSIVKEELSTWQPQSPNSEKQEKEEDKTPERKRGFLENFFQGLT